MTSTYSIPIDQLRAELDGRVITPDDGPYDEMRQVMAGGIDRRPALIARPSSAADVARIVGLARDTGMELAVRSGGHSGAGHGTTDGGVVIDMRDMKALDIDVENRTAWAETGLTAGEVTSATAEHGLAIGFGDTGSVGIGGITVGGGVGFLVRKHGLTIDNVLAAEVVTADGQIVTADHETNADLFWAIRGGGGNFGVVTRFKFRLVELDGIVGGILILPATAANIEAFIAAADAAPEELSTIANVMPAPPMPFLPEDVHGKLVILGMLVYAGDADAGAKAMAPFRAIDTPLADMVGPKGYPEMFPPADPEYHPTAAALNLFIDHVDRPTAETIMQWLERSDAAMRVAQLRVLGGAMARVPTDATAFAHRSSRIMVNVAAFYEGPEDRVAKERWVADFAAALNQGDHGAYVNFVGDEGPERVRAAYPEGTWERLVSVKRRYDPTNLFRLNQNIAPA